MHIDLIVTYQHIYRALCNSSVDPLCAPFSGPSVSGLKSSVCSVCCVIRRGRSSTDDTAHRAHQDSESFSSVKYSNLIKSCSTNQVGYTQLNRHRSFTCQWILGVIHLQCSPSVQIWCALHSHHHPLMCSACRDIHHSRQSAF